MASQGVDCRAAGGADRQGEEQDWVRGTQEYGLHMLHEQHAAAGDGPSQARQLRGAVGRGIVVSMMGVNPPPPLSPTRGLVHVDLSW